MNKTKIISILKKILIVLFIGLVVIQVFHPVENKNIEITASDITKIYELPDSIHQILSKACYDCHSNNTKYPWYNRVQPVAWWLNDHINEGKRHVNFSEFGKNTNLKQAKKLRKCAKEIEEGGMPLDSYLWIHKEADLTKEEKQYLITWLNNTALQIDAKNNSNVK